MTPQSNWFWQTVSVFAFIAGAIMVADLFK